MSIKNIIKKYQNSGTITPAIITQDKEFNEFLTTLPDNLRLTPEKDYYLYKSWKINGKPKTFNDAIGIMFNWDESDKKYHGSTIMGYSEDGIGLFAKPKHHPTVKYELDWFNKGLSTLPGGKQVPLSGDEKKFWKDFKSKYNLDSTAVDYRYVPKKQQGGNFPNLIGGVFYQPSHTNRQYDVYGDLIDFDNLYALSHNPFYVSDESLVGYSPRYTFAKTNNDSSNQSVQEENEVITSDGLASQPQVQQSENLENSTAKSFVGKEGFKKLVKLYEGALENRGIDKSYAKWLASKDALETGWGEKSKGVKYFNYGNITAGSNWKGNTYSSGDHDAKGNKITQTFRAYNSINDYIEDQLSLLTTLERYKNVFTGKIDEFADRLYNAGYAEDSKYAKKIKQVYNSW